MLADICTLLVFSQYTVFSNVLHGLRPKQSTPSQPQPQRRLMPRAKHWRVSSYIITVTILFYIIVVVVLRQIRCCFDVQSSVAADITSTIEYMSSLLCFRHTTPSESSNALYRRSSVVACILGASGNVAAAMLFSRWLPPLRQRLCNQVGLCDILCLSVCLSVCLHVCHSVCAQNYCKSSQPISLKLGVMIGLPIGRTD